MSGEAVRPGQYQVPPFFRLRQASSSLPHSAESPPKPSTSTLTKAGRNDLRSVSFAEASALPAWVTASIALLALAEGSPDASAAGPAETAGTPTDDPLAEKLSAFLTTRA